MGGLSQTNKKLKKLESLWAGQETLLIVMQDNPDPDLSGGEFTSF